MKNSRTKRNPVNRNAKQENIHRKEVAFPPLQNSSTLYGPKHKYSVWGDKREHSSAGKREILPQEPREEKVLIIPGKATSAYLGLK